MPYTHARPRPSLCHIRLQPLSDVVTATVTYGYRLVFHPHEIALKPLVHNAAIERPEPPGNYEARARLRPPRPPALPALSVPPLTSPRLPSASPSSQPCPDSSPGARAAVQAAHGGGAARAAAGAARDLPGRPVQVRRRHHRRRREVQHAALHRVARGRATAGRDAAQLELHAAVARAAAHRLARLTPAAARLRPRAAAATHHLRRRGPRARRAAARPHRRTQGPL